MQIKRQRACGTSGHGASYLIGSCLIQPDASGHSGFDKLIVLVQIVADLINWKFIIRHVYWNMIFQLFNKEGCCSMP